MPLITPSSGESQDDFINRCMSNDTMQSEFPEQDQRVAICFDTWRDSKNKQLEKARKLAKKSLNKIIGR